ncbi:MAG: PAS domain S-box protein [Rhodothermaceae bacterium]
MESHSYENVADVRFDDYDFLILSGDFSIVAETINNYLNLHRIPAVYISHKKDQYIVNNNFAVINPPITKNNLCTSLELAELKLSGPLSVCSNKYYQKLIQNSTDLTLIIDNEGLISFVSPVIERVSGFKRFEVTGENIFSYTLPVDHEKLINIISAKKEIENPVELRLKNKNGKYVWMEANFKNCLSDELIGGFVVNARDISDRKLTQHSYKEEKSIFYAVLQNAPDAFVLFNSDGEISFLNCAFSKMSGFSYEELSNINDWVKFAIPEKYSSEGITNALGGKNKHRTTKIKRRDGVVADIEYDIIELHNCDLLLTMKDITKYKKSQIALSNSLDLLTANKFILENRNAQLAELNERLKESERSLSESNLSKDKFFSIIAHDLRSPFNSLLGMTSLLISEYDFLEKDEVLKFLSDIKTSSQNIFRLLENLLSWAKLNSGMIEFNPSNVDLFEISSRVKGTLNYNAKYKNINLVNRIKKNQLVVADEQMLQSVFQNLLSNSIKFTNAGGEIVIDSDFTGENYSIIVRDTGIGISEEDLENLFRIDINSSKRGTNNESGSGIGLILCKEFIEKNGGKLKVNSEVGEGTTFNFTVPAVEITE